MARGHHPDGCVPLGLSGAVSLQASAAQLEGRDSHWHVG